MTSPITAPGARALETTREHLCTEAARMYRERYHVPPAVIASAPGRVNLIGEHTDYNEGFVLPVAINRSLAIAAGPRTDGKLVMASGNLDSAVQVAMDDLRSTREDAWSNYVKGVAFFLQKRGHVLDGANLYIQGDIPAGAGLSSSAALEVAAFRALALLNHLTVDDLAAIALCRQAENEFAGLNCGIMDQFVSVLGKKDHALSLDCRSLEYRHIPFPRGVGLIVCFTGVRRNLADSAYNKRRQECLFGVKLISSMVPAARSFRDISPEQLKRYRDVLDPTIWKRCRHVVSENSRVVQSVDALLREDLREFGKLMYQSHLSLKTDYEVSCAELDAVVDICAGVDGVYGARMTGGGFGGSAVCLAKESAIAEVVFRLEREYPRTTGRTPLVLVCATDDGAVARRV